MGNTQIHFPLTLREKKYRKIVSLYFHFSKICEIYHHFFFVSYIVIKEEEACMSPFVQRSLHTYQRVYSCVIICIIDFFL